MFAPQPKPTLLRRALFLVAALWVCLFHPSPSHAQEAPQTPRELTVDLYTIGPGNYLYARHGHSALCVTGGPYPEGRCYDYGVPDVQGEITMLWGTLRGEALFVVVGVDQRTLVNAFASQERQIQKQQLPLSQDEAQRILAILDDAVKNKERYAYHPSTANCTTKIRDAIDTATNGKLHDVKSPPSVPRYREILEDGLRGRVPELAVVALFSGTTIERPPNAWEHLFHPPRLRDAVEERFGVKPEMVYTWPQASVQVGTLGGRLFWVAVGGLLAILAWRARGVSEKRTRELGTLGFILGLLGFFIWFAAIAFVYPELSHNWVLGVLWPTDFALKYLPLKHLRRYLIARLGVILPLGILSLAGIIAQPIFSIVLFAALPFAVTLRALNMPAPASKSTPTAPSTSS
ncbi:MAG: DUF4105 domain-containing protein [Polyangiaceae bacterium]|nr:DUF4105 domain-containing protein [Polyangiaceae bacterium]